MSKVAIRSTGARKHILLLQPYRGAGDTAETFHPTPKAPSAILKAAKGAFPHYSVCARSMKVVTNPCEGCE